jgi:hypothetical protein
MELILDIEFVNKGAETWCSAAMALFTLSIVQETKM